MIAKFELVKAASTVNTVEKRPTYLPPIYSFYQSETIGRYLFNLSYDIIIISCQNWDQSKEDATPMNLS